jgi:hypothetical protein
MARMTRKRSAASKKQVDSEPEVFVEDRDFEEEDVELDSDHLDSDDASANKRKRKRASPTKNGAASRGAKSTKSRASPRKKRSKADESEGEFSDLDETQEVVGTVVQAPKTGRGPCLINLLLCLILQLTLVTVPPGQISHNTFSFLRELAKPECNDREWCASFRPLR